MKLKVWLISALASVAALSALAQSSTSTPPSAPAASSSETPAKPKAKKSKPSSVKSDITLPSPVNATVNATVLDVRAQGSFAGEVIAHVKKGDIVTVVGEVTLGHTHPNEPEQWSRIVLPTNTPVWVDADYIDTTTDTVKAKRVNVRGGPGENYSIMARLEKGVLVKEIRKQGGWIAIEAPADAYAYVASEYLEKQPESGPAPLATTPTPSPVATAPAPVNPTPQTVVVNVPTETPPVAVQPADATPAKPADAAPVAPAPTATTQTEQELSALHKATPAEPANPTASTETVKETQGPRVVTREGFVHRAFNIQAPSGYELHDIKSGELIEYIVPDAAHQKFKIFVGTRVRLTGTEFYDPYFPRTPVMKIQTIDLMP